MIFRGCFQNLSPLRVRELTIRSIISVILVILYDGIVYVVLAYVLRYSAGLR